MKKRLIILIASAALAAGLAIPKELVSPVITAIYCKTQPSECSQPQEEEIK